MTALKYFNSPKFNKLQHQKNRTTKIKGLVLVIPLCVKIILLLDADLLNIFYLFIVLI